MGNTSSSSHHRIPPHPYVKKKKKNKVIKPSLREEEKKEPIPMLQTIEEEKEEKLSQYITDDGQAYRKASVRNDLIDNAKSIIDAANIKIQTLNSRLNNHKLRNRELESEIAAFEAEEKEKLALSEEYRIDIENQKTIIIKWKEKMQELSEEIILIREKEREQELQYSNKNISISDNLYKISGDSVSKLKYSQKHQKFVIFTEKINQLFYYDDSSVKIVFVRGITINNNDIQLQMKNKPWFLIIGKKRSVLFITENMKMRDKWVNFINRSLANKSNHDSDDEISVLTSLVDVDYDVSNNSRTHVKTASTSVSLTNYTNYANQYHHKRGNKTFNSLTLNSNNLMSKGRRRKKHNRSESMTLLKGIDEQINVMVMYEIKLDKIELFLKIIKQLIIQTNKEKGCIKFNIHKDKSSKNKFIMMEIWRSQKYLTMHLQKRHLKQYRDIIAKNDVHKSRPSVFFCNTLY